MTNLDKPASFISKNIYRPIKGPSPVMPYYLRSMGHCRSSVGWKDSPLIKTFVQIFWGVKGQGVFTHQGQKMVLSEGQTFVFYPGQRHLLEALSDYWEYRFFTIEGEGALDLTKQFGLGPSVNTAGKCPISFFEELGVAILDTTPNGLVYCAKQAFQLLALAAGIASKKQYSKLVEDCLGIMSAEVGNLSININILAERLGVHRSLLSRQFSQETGLTPIDYLISKRISLGLQLLQETRKPINEVAFICGYHQADYFAKAIKKVTGLTPREIRKNTGIK